VTFFWIPIEDVNMVWLTAIAVVWAAWLGVWATWRGVLAGWRWRLALLGAGAGLLFFPLAIAFILFKSGLHAHGFLDFSLYQISRLAWMTPVWMVFGGGAGAILTRFRFWS